MPDTVNGLPLHPLVVHAVVVLLPIAVIGTLACVLRPAIRRHFGVLVVLTTAAAVVLIPVATQSGERFARTLGAEQLVADHQRHAEMMFPFGVLLLLSITLLVALDIYRRTATATAGAAGPPAPAAPQEPDHTATAAPGSRTGGTATAAPALRTGGTATAVRAAASATGTRPAPPLTVVDSWLGDRVPARWRGSRAETVSRRLALLAAALCVVTSVGTGVVTFQTGESGAKAVWSSR